MQAIILAGGVGSRLQPLTAEQPKSLVKIGDRPIIEYLLLHFKKYGITDFTLAVNHHAEIIEEHLKDGSALGVSIKYSREEKPLSTVAPLKLIDKLDDDFIVANSDILTDLDVSKLIEFHRKEGSMVTVATVARKHKVDYGVIGIDQENSIISFSEKPQIDYLVSMGIYVFKKELLDMIPENEKFGFDDLMNLVLENRISAKSFLFDGFWLDIGRVEDYLEANNNLDKIKNLMNLS